VHTVPGHLQILLSWGCGICCLVWRFMWPGFLLTLLYSLASIGLPWCVSPAWGEAASRAALAPPVASMQEGLHAFQRGDFTQAIANWHEAVSEYARMRQPQAHSRALIHLARAYEALGHYDQAQAHLRIALQLLEGTTEQTQRARILGDLSQLALARGEIAEAERLVREALLLVHDLSDAGLSATLLHVRGNVFMAQQQPQEALAVYRDSAAFAQRSQHSGMVARAFAHAALAAERAGQVQVAMALLEETQESLRQAESSHATAYDYLLVGHLYHRLAAADAALVLRAAGAFRAAAEIAHTLQDARALTYAWGYLGRLYEDEQRYQEALELTRRAILAAQQVHMPEALYLWQWQSGRLLRALGHLQPAIAAYSRAVDTVQTLRTAPLHAYGSTFTSFRTAVRPLYFELADLFLHRAAALEAQKQEAAYPQYEIYLYQARAVIEQFKAAELQDYFGDACVAAAQPRTTVIERVSPDAVIVYPILLPHRTDILVSFPTGLQRITIPVPGPQLEQRVHIFRNALEDRDPLRYRQHAQQLYTWLIRPLEADLAAWHIQTLVFVPDGALRALPLAALHDGQRFLIEKYALAITPSLTLTDPRPLPRRNLRVLAVGLADAVADFPPLPRVPDELHSIQQLYGGPILLDQAFSLERLDETLQQGQFGILHIASHGYFAPEAAQSFLLTAQGKLTLAQLAQVIGRLRFRDQPLELLTLSACETARGDDRAALGLAGIAIQAGARSALATLWLVEDEAAAVLMTEFYRHLQVSGMSRVQSLQLAQLTLLRHQQYTDPFFWAPFLLINNWL
jgi:CHAT domain-containing protein